MEDQIDLLLPRKAEQNHIKGESNRSLEMGG
jgi:hypothetical protein